MLGTLRTLNPAVPAPGSTQSWLGALALQKVWVLADATLGRANSTSIAPANDSSLATRIVDLLVGARFLPCQPGPSFSLADPLKGQRVCQMTLSGNGYTTRGRRSAHTAVLTGSGRRSSLVADGSLRAHRVWDRRTLGRL